MTHRLEEMTGRRVARGDTLVSLIGVADSVELRVTLAEAGATLVRPGQSAAVIAMSNLGVPLRAKVASVAESGETFAVASTPPRTTVEVRIRVPAGTAWRSGVTGRASITIRRTNLFTALWWAVRKRFRSDLLM